MNGHDEEKRYNELLDLVTGEDSSENNMQDDLKKFYGKGNKAAGTRARKGLQKLKELAQEIRMEIQDIKNNEM
jgi:predicted flap endonuclease-1-like 5' DNA nuclease